MWGYKQWPSRVHCIAWSACGRNKGRVVWHWALFSITAIKAILIQRRQISRHKVIVSIPENLEILHHGGNIMKQVNVDFSSNLPVIMVRSTDLVTYCRFASQFLLCNTSAAFTICDVNCLQHFLSCASSVISARSLLECSLIGCWTSARSLLNTIGKVVFGRPRSLLPLGIK